MRKLVIATRNKGKVKEISHIVAELGLDYELLTLADFPQMPEIEENGNSFVDNALLKAEATAAFTGELSLADDSGLIVDILGGIPGIKSARFGGDISDAEKCLRLLEMIENVPKDSRSARFMCAVAIVDTTGGNIISSGMCEGELAYGPKGENGFGYDPIFYIPELNRTLAELPEEEKNKISHRSKAIRKALDKLK